MTRQATMFQHVVIDYLSRVRVVMGKPHGRPYTCAEDFVWREGYAFDEIEPRAPTGQRGHCFKNAFNLAYTEGRSKYWYVEGWCEAFGIPIEHAWCIDYHGRVIDPTLEGCSGYVGVVFSHLYILKASLSNHAYGILERSSKIDLLDGSAKGWRIDHVPRLARKLSD